MNKLKRFIDCYISTEACNLRCHYCYITQKHKFNNKLMKLNRSPKEIRQALSTKRLGGTCLINMCAGGETLLVKDLIDVIKELLKEGHYIMIVTNGVLSKRFDEITKIDKHLLKHLFIKFSFHYLELIRLKKIEEFFINVNKMKMVGCSFTVEITPSDELIPHIDDIKKICTDNLGILCHVTIARDDRTKNIEVLSKHSFDKYKKIWGVFNSDLFKFKTSIFYIKRKEFCYAGDWSAYLNLMTGRLSRCYGGKEIDNIYRNTNKSINFKAIGYNCALAHCYNGHAFLTLGAIPDLNTPTYAQMRDRININKEHWLQPEVIEFFSQKLSENNKQYSKIRKLLYYIIKLLTLLLMTAKKILKKLIRYKVK